MCPDCWQRTQASVKGTWLLQEEPSHKPAAASRGTRLLPSAPPNAGLDRLGCWGECTDCWPIWPCLCNCISSWSQEESQAFHYLPALPGPQLGHMIITSYNSQLPLVFMTLISPPVSGHILEENHYPLNRIWKALPVCQNGFFFFFLVNPIQMPNGYTLEALVCWFIIRWGLLMGWLWVFLSLSPPGDVQAQWEAPT